MNIEDCRVGDHVVSARCTPGFRGIPGFIAYDKEHEGKTSLALSKPYWYEADFVDFVEHGSSDFKPEL